LVNLLLAIPTALAGATLDLDQLSQVVTSLQGRLGQLEQERLGGRLWQLEQEHEAALQRIAVLEARLSRIAGQPGRTIQVATQSLGATRRLSESTPSCCRWTAAGACGSNVTKDCTQLHEYLEHKTTTHHFDDVDACPGAAPWVASLHPQDAEVALTASGSEVKRFKTPLRVLHAADCATAPSLELQLAVNLASTFALQGVDLTAQLQQLNPANRVCVRTETTNSGYGQFYVQDIHSPPGEFRLVAGDKFTTGEQSTCFQGFIKLGARGPNDDAWAGYLGASTDGGATYDGTFTCASCSNSQTVSMTDQIIIDASNTNDGSGARCLGQDLCELTLDGWTYDGTR